MRDPVEALVSPLRNSPLLPEIADVLQRQVAEERLRRASFYEEMEPSQKVEFIDGEGLPFWSGDGTVIGWQATERRTELKAIQLRN